MSPNGDSGSINMGDSDAMVVDDVEEVRPVKKKAKSSIKSSTNKLANDVAQASTSSETIQSELHTSMPLPQTLKKEVKSSKRGLNRYAWRTRAENSLQSEEIFQRVKMLQDVGQGSCHILKAKQKAPYTLGQAYTTADCYMGPIQSQTLQSIPADNGETLSKLVDDEEKLGALLYVGGHIYSADWLPQNANDQQYLCISASMQKKANTLIGEKLNSTIEPARLQIWSIDQAYKSILKLVLCFDQGWISCVRWVPILSDVGEDSSILGLLSACMQDGTVGIYSIPHPSNFKLQNEPIYLKLDPLVQLNVKMGVPTCMDWYDADKLAIGYSDGWISVWSLLACLQVGTRRARPQVFSKVSSSPITSLSWHLDGRQIFSSSYDGSTRCMSLAHPHLSTTIYHSRDVSYAIAFSEALGLPVMERPELDDIRIIDFQEGKSHLSTLYSHSGRIRTMSLSPHHSFIASGSVDGTVRVVNLASNVRNKGIKTSLKTVLAIFRLDKNRGKEALRFVENLALYSASQNVSASTMAWDPDISLTTVCWNTNPGTESWLASAFACGFLRIDVVEEVMLY